MVLLSNWTAVIFEDTNSCFHKTLKPWLQFLSFADVIFSGMEMNNFFLTIL